MFGRIVRKRCNCGDYTPSSTKGLIDTRCKNCGGYKESIVYGPGSMRSKPKPNFNIPNKKESIWGKLFNFLK